MKFTSTTAKIPKGFGFILKPSWLSEAIEAAGIEIEVTLHRLHSRRLFDVDYWTPNARVPYDRLYIVVGTVATKNLYDVRSKVRRESIPTLIKWVSNLSPDYRNFVELLPPRDH